jgi:N-acyl-D-aspartate/D-glutamate deacylase
MKYLTIEEFIRKTSVNPARMFGFTTKGSLREGMDADITVLDLHTCKAVMGIANGRIIMLEGRVTGSGGTLLTTTSVSGKHMQQKDFRQIDMNRSLLYCRN